MSLILKDAYAASVVYDAQTGEHRVNSVIVEQSTSQEERVKSFAYREDEWEAFCVNANRDDELSDRVKARIRKELGL